MGTKLTPTQEALVKSFTRKATPNENVKPTLKRRVGYVEEEVSITHAKLSKMEISEDIKENEEKGKDSREEVDEPEENT